VRVEKNRIEIGERRSGQIEESDRTLSITLCRTFLLRNDVFTLRLVSFEHLKHRARLNAFLHVYTENIFLFEYKFCVFQELFYL